MVAMSPLIVGLNFTFESGVNILITGGSGCGKSSLLRVINGIWPEVRGMFPFLSCECVYVSLSFYVVPAFFQPMKAQSGIVLL